MSIILIDKKSLTPKQISINSEFLNTQILKKIVSTELACHSSEIQLFHTDTNKQYGQNEIVKQGDKVYYLVLTKAQSNQSSDKRKKGVVYPDELEKIIENSKVIVIKSANEENIQKSKEHSLWATTFSNQERLKYFFNNSPNVILIFATNRSYEIKGIARMQSQPDKLTDKSVWSGVSNIRLGGNFKIKWLRKKPLSLVNVQKNLGTILKESIIKSCDGQQLDPNLCKKLAYVFQTPEGPYYEFKQKTQQKYPPEFIKKVNQKQSMANSLNQINFNLQPLKSKIPLPQVQNSPKKQSQKQHSVEEGSSSGESSSEILSKKKKIKKHKKKKGKKQKKNRSKHRSQSSSVSSKFDQSSQQDRKKKKKKAKKHKKAKKGKKSHS